MSDALPILERDAELLELNGLLAAAAQGHGAVVVLEGPAGIGKTSILRLAREDAVRQGFVVLSATASELERDFPFGIVRQLLDPVLVHSDRERRDRLFAGAAELAEKILSPTATPEPAADRSHAALHAMYWLVSALTDEAPLALVVDDLHWSDPPSLRFLEFVGRRLEGLALLVAGTVRTGEPGSADAVLAAVLTGPTARVITPAPLSDSAVAQLVGAALGTAPDAAFAQACVTASGGNPLLAREVARGAAEGGLSGDASQAGEVLTIGSAGLAARTRRRLLALGADAAAVARAVAVLGERALLDDVATLAQVSPAAAGEAIALLTGAEILAPEGRGFAHPLVREAVRAGIARPEQRRLHTRAARILAARQGRLDEIAVHLLGGEPAGDAWVVEQLRAAARGAAAEGALEPAIADLTRALAEPPEPARRPEILLELGELQARTGDAGALSLLDEALTAGLQPDLAARAHAARGQILAMSHDPSAAAGALEEALADARDPALAVRIQAGLLDMTATAMSLRERRRELLAQGLAAPSPSVVMLAHIAFEQAYRADRADETLRLVTAAIDGGLLLAAGVDSLSFHFAIHALRHLEQPTRAMAAIEAAEAQTRRSGSRLAAFYLAHSRAYWSWLFGSQALGEAQARAALEAAQGPGLDVGRLSSLGVLLELLLERGDDEGAVALVGELPLSGKLAEALPAPDGFSVRAEVRRRQARPDEAEADLRRAIELLRARDWRAPLKSRAGLRLGELLGERGDREQALAVIAEEEAAACRAGTAGALGATLRVRGKVTGGDAGIALLREAADLLAGSPLALLHAQALLDLGSALRRAGARRDAREPLRIALDLAAGLDAGHTATAARDELLAAGARPQRTALSGPAALTPSERRVAEHAARGLTNREIAETLWVTRKTVEVHLSNAYDKLGIRSRLQLAGALGIE